MAGQLGRVVDANGQRRGLRVGPGLHDAHDLQILAGIHKGAHVVLVVGLIHPHRILLIVGVTIGGGHHLERHSHEFLVGELQLVVGGYHLLLVHELVDHVLQHGVIPQTEGVGDQIGQSAARGEHDDALVVGLGPSAGLHVVLALHDGGIAHHLVEHVGAVHRGHERVGRRAAAHTEGLEGGIGVDLAHLSFCVAGEHLGRHVVAVLDGAHIVADAVTALVEELLERGQVVVLQTGEHVGDHAGLGHRGAGRRVVLVTVGAPFHAGSGQGSDPVATGARGVVGSPFPVIRIAARGHSHERAHVEARGHDLERVHRQRLLLGLLDVVVHAVGQRQNGGGAHDADRAGEGRHDGAALLGHEVVE